ncbi:KpsF/GutQ family sugar-phosphate isomerase [Novosphingobium umbonatum]|uniref:KpsF/GutQ family sugar-phosphate isomerase n=1 Tax=Novosphingobium umbonatum TaxID=1908524 RepID=A0A3S2Y6F5_9SPHN|nr:KpsF/GutQ family sugar-phosphate isomerase [Novosphingobium umbonatum]RVU03260.1 KpsF/GutQ family sugar-phosphate isomerase [Novosphingobium umbonatum]
MTETSSVFTLGAGFDAYSALERGREVIRQERDGLDLLARSLDEAFAEACSLIIHCRRRVVVCGMGKSGHVGRKMSATLSATGSPSVFLHPAEAAHGDLGMMVQGDVLVLISNSGNTRELRPVIAHAQAMGLKMIGIVSDPESMVGEAVNVLLTLPPVAEACEGSMAPTTSTTLQLALGDALALSVMQARGVTQSRIRALHPGGSIGLRLTPVAEVMQGPSALPLVERHTPMAEVVSVITNGRFGLAGVVDEVGDLCGVITDGDLRRHFAMLAHATAAQVMTRSPRSIPSDMLAGDVLQFLNDEKITAAFVVKCGDPARSKRPVGIVHIHDLLQLGLS